MSLELAIRSQDRKRMNEEQSNFKVTDRRLFNPDGTPRDISPEEKREPAPAVAAVETGSSTGTAQAAQATQAAPSPSEPARTIAEETSEAEDSELLDAEDPAGFVSFIMSIASNAASSLGMMEHPITHKREVDLEIGKHWIDVLGMLELKTKGNLVPQEEQILESLLSDLRMQYVSLVNSPKTGNPRTYTGRDIIGGK